MSHSFRTLREGNRLTQEQALAEFGDSQIADRLAGSGALTPVAGGWKISFVGAAVLSGRPFWFAPKYAANLDAARRPQSIRAVVRALQNYSRRNTQLIEECRYLTSPISGGNGGILALADWLIRDYCKSGIYRRSARAHEWNGQGSVNWSRTIAAGELVISNGQPLYLKRQTRKISADLSYVVASLHRYAIEESLKLYGPLLGYSGISTDHERAEVLRHLPPLSLIAAVLQRELRQAYADRSIQLLRVLAAWFGDQAHSGQTSVQLYGTSHFHTVWEAACGAVLANEFEQWRAYMPKPRWISLSGEVQEEPTLRPDIIRGIGKASDKVLVLADAKYYALIMPPCLSGNPGVQDVAKQLFYERVLKQPASENGYARIVNCFLLPTEEDDIARIRGKVEMDGLDAGPVKVIYLSAHEILSRYVSSASISDADLRIHFEIENAVADLV
jgi:hypothetical protein